jgi:hypothetical protein
VKPIGIFWRAGETYWNILATCWNLLSKYGDFGNASDIGIAWDARERERRERDRGVCIWVCASDALVLVY